MRRRAKVLARESRAVRRMEAGSDSRKKKDKRQGFPSQQEAGGLDALRLMKENAKMAKAVARMVDRSTA